MAYLDPDTGQRVLDPEEITLQPEFPSGGVPPVAPPPTAAPDPFALGAPPLTPVPTVDASRPSGLPPLGQPVTPVPGAPPISPAGAPPPVIPPTAAKPQTATATSESFVRPTKNEAGLQRNANEASRAKIAAEGKSSDAKITAAKAEVTGAQAEADAAAKADLDAANLRKARQDANAAGHAELATQREQIIKDGAKGYWEDKSTGSLVASALMAGIGQFASALTGGPNQALNVINAAMESDAKRKMEKTRAQLEANGVKGAELDKQLGLALTEIENGQAATAQALANQRKIRLAKNNVGQAEADKDVLTAGLQQTAAEKQLAAEQRLEHHVTVQTAPVAAGAGAAGKPNAEALKSVDQLNGDLANIDRVIETIKKSPKAWVEYRKQQEHWKRMESGASTGVLGAVRHGAQAVGLADVAPEQGLKSDEAKQIHSGMSSVLNGIAKGYGGVITGSDRESASGELSQMSNSPVQQIHILQRFKNKMERSRDLYLQNVGVQNVAPVSGGDTKQLRDRVTGKVVTARKGPDGQWYPVQ